MNKRASTSMTIITLAILVTVSMISTPVLAYYGSGGYGHGNRYYPRYMASSPHDRYELGYQDGISMCESGQAFAYAESDSYLYHHSSIYQQGFTEGADSCEHPHVYDHAPPQLTTVSHHDHGTTTSVQGQSSKQGVTCIVAVGDCNVTSGQAQDQQN